MNVGAVKSLRNTYMLGVCAAALLILPQFAQAFDPNQGSEPTDTKPTKTSTRLPSTEPLTGQPPRIVFPEVTGVVPTPPSAPEQTSAAPAIAEAPALPPVDPAVAAQAARELNQQPQPGFIAPAPLIALPEPATSAPAPVVAASEPLVNPAPLPNAIVYSPGAPAAAPAPQSEELSKASKSILSSVPSKIDSPKATSGKFNVSRMTPELHVLADKPKVETYDAVGLSIKVQRPGLDANYELNRAYNALMGGDVQTATSTYKNILSTEPNNEDALFGLASIYHRAGDLDKARPYYGQLLKVNPNHREGLNNFMALISDEAPQEALAELERLEQRNPEFSPIPAQQAVVLNRLGFKEQAADKMMRAIELSPENLTYKYNLAVMLDKSGDYTNAAALYRLLLDAYYKGEKIPSPADSIQKRLNYIASADVNNTRVVQ